MELTVPLWSVVVVVTILNLQLKEIRPGANTGLAGRGKMGCVRAGEIAKDIGEVHSSVSSWCMDCNGGCSWKACDQSMLLLCEKLGSKPDNTAGSSTAKILQQRFPGQTGSCDTRWVLHSRLQADSSRRYH